MSTEVKIQVPSSIEALMTSCVVIPCSFKHVEEDVERSGLKGIWYRRKKNDEKEMVYDEDQTRAAETFRDRTRLLGRLGQNNCTLEMLTVAEHDDGLYCFTMDSQDNPSHCTKINIRCTSLTSHHHRPTIQFFFKIKYWSAVSLHPQIRSKSP